MNTSTIDFFNKQAKDWDNTNADFEGAKKIVDIFFDSIKNKSILDVGCGTGVLFKYLTQANAKSITAIDVSEKMIEMARNKYPDGNFHCIDIFDMNENNKFDTVIIYNAYPHFLNKCSLVNKVWSLLNKDGIFIVAHGAGKEKINSHHQAHALDISNKLLPAKEEACQWSTKFEIAHIVDTKNIYYFSGRKLN